jgi:ethanolamine utilization protein EutQ
MPIDEKTLEQLIRKVISETLANPDNCADNPVQPSGLQKEEAGGVIAVRAAAVRPPFFDTGKPGTQVYIQDIFSRGESPRLGSGIMEMHGGSSFDWTLKYDEIDYIIDGVLDILIDGCKVTARSGDILLIPKNSSITFSTPDHTRFMYVTYPADWQDQ